MGLCLTKVIIKVTVSYFGNKELSASFHKEPMGEGTPSSSNKPQKEWNYPPPNEVTEIILKKVCSR